MKESREAAGRDLLRFRLGVCGGKPPCLCSFSAPADVQVQGLVHAPGRAGEADGAPFDDFGRIVFTALGLVVVGFDSDRAVQGSCGGHGMR